jgi:hypothetical protein
LIYKVDSDNSGHRLLSPFQIPNHVAIKIALELKKLLVDNSLLDVYVHPSLHYFFPPDDVLQKMHVCTCYIVAVFFSPVYRAIACSYVLCCS